MVLVDVSFIVFGFGLNFRLFWGCRCMFWLVRWFREMIRVVEG